MELQTHQGSIGEVCFSPDGQMLALAGRDGTVQLCELALNGATPAAAECLEVLEAHQGGSSALAFSPDGCVLASGGVWTDQTIRLWQVVTGEPIKVITHSNSAIYRLVFSPDGGTLTAGGTWAVEKRNTETGNLVSALGRGVRDIAVSQDGLWLVMAVAGGGVQVWETSPNRCLTRREAHEGVAYTLAVAPHGRLAATGGQDAIVRIWDVAERREITFLKKHRAPIDAVRFSPDGTYLASASIDGVINIWDVATWKSSIQLTGFSPNGAAIAFHPDSRRIVSGQRHGRFTVWDIPSGRELTHFETQAMALWACFSPDGALLATTSRNPGIRLWSGHTFEPLDTLHSPQEPTNYWSLALGPDGRTLAAGFWASTIELWDLPSRRVTVLEGHDALVRFVAFDPHDGRLLASASNDGTIKLWDTGSHECLATLNPHSAAVYAVPFVPRGPAAGQLLSVHGDGTVGFWELGYYNQHIAGNLEGQLTSLLPDLADEVDVDRVRRVVADLQRQ